MMLKPELTGKTRLELNRTPEPEKLPRRTSASRNGREVDPTRSSWTSTIAEDVRQLSSRSSAECTESTRGDQLPVPASPAKCRNVRRIDGGAVRSGMRSRLTASPTVSGPLRPWIYRVAPLPTPKRIVVLRRSLAVEAHKRTSMDSNAVHQAGGLRQAATYHSVWEILHEFRDHVL